MQVNRFKQIFKFVATTTIALLLFSGASVIKESSSFHVLFSTSAEARDFRAEQVAKEVYDRLSFLPKENDYINSDTGKIDRNRTLARRFIRYHIYVKGRSVLSRFDWKLTLADYLGYNEPLLESRYPDYKTLAENPRAGDRQAINNLTVEQRNLLVETVFSIYNPDGAKLLLNQPNPQTTEESTEQENDRPRLHRPQPGDADLLKF